MDNSEFLVLQPHELTKIARGGFTKNEEALLKNVDLAFHHMFLLRSKKGTEEARVQFIDAVLGVTESSDSALPLNLTLPQRMLIRWEHLAELMEAFRHDRDRIADALRLLNTGKWFRKIVLEVISKNGGSGWKVHELARKLKISSPQLDANLKILEEQDIIERQRSGRNTFVSLGLVGQLVAEQLRERTQGTGSDEVAEECP